MDYFATFLQGGLEMPASEMIRKMFRAADDKRDADLTTPKEVKRFDDILYGTDEEWQRLDVYRPKNIEGDLPVIVSVHGGGWVYGDKERYQFYCMDLAKRGFAVVNFTYRLAPEFKFPAPLEDTNLVFTWVLEHAKEYGFDLEHVFAVGDSAGGHILGLYSCFCTNEDCASNYEFNPPEGFVPKAIALNCGVYEIDTENGNQADLELMKEVLPNGGTKEELEKMNVLSYVNEKFPNTFYMTATGDFLIDQAKMLGVTLVKQKVPNEFHFYGDANHQLGHVFHLDIRSEAAIHCNDEECAFFQRHCK